MAVTNALTPLTPAEIALIRYLNKTSNRATLLAALKADLQTAVEIELATIPIYLYTYYSLIRNKELGENISDAQLYANKAGGVIMSVAVEEMLHMSLSSNILFAMGVAPQLYRHAPGVYPTPLPYHNPIGPSGPDGNKNVLIPLSKFGFEQLWHFLQIEYPEKFSTYPIDRNWKTIGQFYSYIRCLINTKFITDADFQHGKSASAIQPDNYSPNNIDTVYPSRKFDPWKPAPEAPMPVWAKKDSYPNAAAAAVFADAPDSHAGPTSLMTIASRLDAAMAIDTICDQGEGQASPIGPKPTDDPSKSEASHYFKFLTLQAQLEQYQTSTEQLSSIPKPPAAVTPTMNDWVLSKFVVNFPDSPTNAAYPNHYRQISAFCSALFQYMLIMTETIYRVPPANQKRFFNEGLHRSMIWVLDKYIRTIRDIPIPGLMVNNLPAMMAPTFENVDLGKRVASFAGLATYGNEAIAAAKAIMPTDKNSPLAESLNSVIAYVNVALTKTHNGHAMHLPDVSQYWSQADG